MIPGFLSSFFVLGDIPANALRGSFTPLLVLASYAVAIFGAFTGLSVVNQTSSIESRTKKLLFLGLGAFAYGSGFWAMHFVGMFAFKINMPVSYNPIVTLLSLVISVLTFVAVLSITRLTESPSRLKSTFAGFVATAGYCTMHYIGMEALEMNATLQYLPSLFFLSIGATFLAAQSSLHLIYTSQQRAKGKCPPCIRVFAATIMAIGVCGGYYIGMEATVIVPLGPGTVLSFSPPFLAVSILAVTTLLLVILTFAISNRIFITVGCGALFALPLLIIINQAISGLNAQIVSIEKDRFGIQYHTELAKLFHQIEDLRDLTFVVQSGEIGFSDRIASTKTEIDATIARINHLDLKALKNPQLLDHWKKLKQDILALRKEKTEPAELAPYSRAIRNLSNFMLDVTDEADISYRRSGKDFTLEYSLHALPQMWEAITNLRSRAAGLLASGRPPEQWTPQEKTDLNNAFYHFQTMDLLLDDSLSRTEDMGQEPLRLAKLNKTTVEPFETKLREKIEAMIDGRLPGISSAALFMSATEMRNLFDIFYDKPTRYFLDQTDVRKSSLEFQRAVMVYSSTAAFVGFIVLFAFLNRSLIRLERARSVSLHSQQELAVRLVERERLERQTQEYTDRLELSRFEILAANNRLKNEEAKTRAIMDNVWEGIVLIDQFGTIQMFNKAAERLFGYPAEQAIGQKATFLAPTEGVNKETNYTIAKYIASNCRDFIGVEYPLEGRRSDGSRFPMIAMLSDVTLQGKRFYVVMLRDITAQKEKETDLLRIKERAEAASKTKSEFLANMSHELRTPLNSVVGMSNLLLSTQLTVEQEELASTALASAQNLMEIVNDILDLSKIEAGEVQLERIGFDPRQILHSVVRAQAHQAHEKKIPVIRLYENETFPYVAGDPLRVGRIVTNLLSNAIKYTETGHIEIRATAKPLAPGTVELHCEITDTGVGIPGDKLESIFEKFVQADTSTTRKYGGTGLGLAITRELVAMMGGKIGVRSKIGQGSTFWFVIPFSVTNKLHEEGDAREEKTRKGFTPASKAHILVAEDHPMNQLLMKRILAKFQIGSTEIVANGNEALAALDKKPWTAILMDCHMPEKNGYDATVEIRKIERHTNKHIPIVAMTANAMVGDKEKCLASGMDEYIRKPVDIEDLKAILGQWIVFDADENTMEQAPKEKPPIDLTMLRLLTDAEPEVEKELIKTFILQSDKNLETLRENRSTDGKSKPWAEAAHMFKGASGSIGAEALRQLCNEAQFFNGSPVSRTALFQKIEAEYARVKNHLYQQGFM